MNSIVRLVGVKEVFDREHEYNLLKTKRRQLYLKIQFVPRSKHFSPRL